MENTKINFSSDKKLLKSISLDPQALVYYNELKKVTNISYLVRQMLQAKYTELKNSERLPCRDCGLYFLQKELYIICPKCLQTSLKSKIASEVEQKMSLQNLMREKRGGK